MPSDTSAAREDRPAPEAVPAVIRGVARALEVRRLGLLLAALLCATLAAQAAVLWGLSVRSPGKIYVPEATSLAPLWFKGESRHE